MKYSRFALIFSFLLTGCNLLPVSKNSDEVTSTSTTSISPSTSDDSLSNDTNSNSNDSSDVSSDDYTESTTESDDDYLDGRLVLPCGYVQLDKPTNQAINLNTSNDSSAKYQIDIKDSLDPSMTFIYGNNSSKGPTGHYASPSMYSYNASNEKQYPGGLKIAQRSQGIQSPLFSHNGPKLQIRIGLSQVNEGGSAVEKNKDTGYLYFYNSDGKFLKDKTITIAEGSITLDKAGKYLQYYVTDAEEVAYFEFRINAQPYKSNRVLNFGIGYLAMHSFPQI